MGPKYKDDMDDISICYMCVYIYIFICTWKSKTKQRIVFRMLHVKDCLLPRGKVWYLDFLGIYIYMMIYDAYYILCVYTILWRKYLRWIRMLPGVFAFRHISACGGGDSLMRDTLVVRL